MFMFIYTLKETNMSSEETITQIEVVEQPKPIIINEDEYQAWSDKSKDIPFKKQQKKCVGNGEEKLAKELDISVPVGGQNSSVDLKHPEWGNISVKDMTNDDCILGTEGCHNMRKIFRNTINPFINWIEKYSSEEYRCELAKKFYDDIDKTYGSSRTTIMEGIDRYELSTANLSKLNELLNEHKKKQI